MSPSQRLFIAIGLFLSVSLAVARAQEMKPPELTPEEKKLAEKAARLRREAIQLYRQGQTARAIVKATESLQIRQSIYPAKTYTNGHPDIAASLNLLGVFTESVGSFGLAQEYFEQALAMRSKLYPKSKFPNGHSDLADAFNNIGYLFDSMGSFQKALPYYEHALEMRRKLYPESKYPDGHTDLSNSLNNMGAFLYALGSYKRALEYYEQALAMDRKLHPATRFPNGHIKVAVCLNNLGHLFIALKDHQNALVHFQESLEIRQKLYPESSFPDGHPDLAGALNSLANALHAIGKYENALTNYELALAMYRRFYPASHYPDGHPDLAMILDNLGALLWMMGTTEKALHYSKQAVTMDCKLNKHVLATASESEALAFANAHPLRRDFLLSLATHMPDSESVAYAAAWESKGIITRVLEQRHAAARVVGTQNGAKLDLLKGLRRRIDQLLQDRRLPSAERDELLVKTMEERDKIERDLAANLPMLRRAKEVDAIGPVGLANVLPIGAVFIDIVRYRHIAYDRKEPGKAGETRSLSYDAFVIATTPANHSGGTPFRVQRIQLGPAKAIEQSIAAWRKSIETLPPQDDRPAAQRVRELVWDKLAPHIPAGTLTIYLAPDGDLGRVPFGALPGSKPGTVLLEEYAIATVPHGQYLLEQLKYPPKQAATGNLLALGGVEYGKSGFMPLYGATEEVKALATLAPVTHETLTKSDATSKRLIEHLPKARYAHLATHGFFDETGLVAEKKRGEDALKNWQFISAGSERRVAAKNPLGFVGLVLANGEVITGLSIVDLPLEKLHLVTLSACETGLKDRTAADGVASLTQAFHVAGCPNVVASLWHVPDVPTLVLMEAFYQRLWHKEKPLPPIEALRRAQLLVLKNPDVVEKRRAQLIAELQKQGLTDAEIASRGVKRDLDPLPEDGKIVRPTRSPTISWAAFVLSGVGR